MSYHRENDYPRCQTLLDSQCLVTSPMNERGTKFTVADVSLCAETVWRMWAEGVLLNQPADLSVAVGRHAANYEAPQVEPDEASADISDDGLSQQFRAASGTKFDKAESLAKLARASLPVWKIGSDTPDT
jgi:hypothetical protein